jgi:hypothetical protein
MVLLPHATTDRTARNAKTKESKTEQRKKVSPLFLIVVVSCSSFFFCLAFVVDRKKKKNRIEYSKSWTPAETPWFTAIAAPDYIIFFWRGLLWH